MNRGAGLWRVSGWVTVERLYSDMYAIIRSGGKQTRVSKGYVIDVELLKDAGDEVTFTPLLVVDNEGAVITSREDLAGMQVKARVLGNVKGRKVEVFKYKNKSGYRRRKGHRQRHTRLEITHVGAIS